MKPSQTETGHNADAPLEDWDVELDAMGLLCPLPVLKARKLLLTMTSGQVLRVLATDPAAVIDMPHFCTENGHAFLGCAAFDPPAQTHLPAAQAYFIRRL
jgi:tRNA 2-thiouridine synthesizing protein A